MQSGVNLTYISPMNLLGLDEVSKCIIPILNVAALDVGGEEEGRLLLSEYFWANHRKNLLHRGLPQLSPEDVSIKVCIKNGDVEWPNWKHTHHSLSLIRVVPQLQDSHLVNNTNCT